MRALACAVVLLSLPAAAGGPAQKSPVTSSLAHSPEVALCATSLRDGERARAEQVLGPLEAIPLYRAELLVDPEDRVVHGRLLLRYPLRGPAPKTLELRLTPNAFHPAAVSLESVKEAGKPLTFDAVAPDRVQVTLGAQDAKATSVELDVAFSARVPRAAPATAGGMGGLALSSQKTDHGAFVATPDALSLVGVLPQVPPVIGKETMPEPGGIGDFALYEPGNYLVSVRVPRGFRVHASGNALGEVPEKDGELRFSFGAAAVRDFPILVSRGDKTAKASLGSLSVESSFAPVDAKAGKQVLGYALAALRQFEKHFGPTPQATFRLVEAPLSGGAGGMEFPGLVTLSASLYHGGAGLFGASGLAGLGGASALLQTPQMDAVANNLLEFSVAHEVAHQYFAGLVGSDPVRDPIVDESLAQDAALLYLGWEHGAKAAEAIRQTQLVLPYQFYRMTGGEDGRAERPTTGYASELEYAALVYAKAPLLHEAQRKLLGEDAYVEGVRAYVDAYRYRWACAECLTRTLVSLHPAKAEALRALRQHWWREAHGDQDLGRPDLSKMVKQLSGTDLDPQSQELLEQLLQGLGGP
jgi:hypothetical protein